MKNLKKIQGLFLPISFLGFFIISCNSAAEKEVSVTDSALVVPVVTDSAGVAIPDTTANWHAVTDSAIKVKPLVPPNKTDTVEYLYKIDSTQSVGPPTIKPGDDITSIAPQAPEASIAYAYKNKMKKGEKGNIQMRVQLSKPIENVVAGLKDALNEQKAIEQGSSDTSIVKSLSIAGDKYFLVSIDYDTAIFQIERSFGEEKQELKFNKPNKWIWRVTAKKETEKSEIFIIVKSEDGNGKIHESDVGVLPIQITVDAPVSYGIEPKRSFFSRYGWVLLVAAVIILSGIMISVWLKRRRERELNSRIFFSYAWDTSMETIIDRLYDSLEKSGYNVIRDKVSLKYRGLISTFMKDIGKGNIIIVALSDKYFRSRFCMFELFEIYRNCGMEKETFIKKVFPIREENIDLSDPAVVNKYVDFWKAEEEEWETIIKDKSQETTTEQFNQYEVIRRISSELANLLFFLSDINALNVEVLTQNDFEEIKTSLNNAIKNLDGA